MRGPEQRVKPTDQTVWVFEYDSGDFPSSVSQWFFADMDQSFDFAQDWLREHVRVNFDNKEEERDRWLEMLDEGKIDEVIEDLRGRLDMSYHWGEVCLSTYVRDGIAAMAEAVVNEGS